MSHPLAMVRCKDDQSAVGEARTLQYIVDETNVRVGHLGLAIAGVDVVAPIELTPLVNSTALFFGDPRQVGVEIRRERGKLVLDGRSVVKLPYPAAGPAGVAAVVRIEEADRKEGGT